MTSDAFDLHWFRKITEVQEQANKLVKEYMDHYPADHICKGEMEGALRSAAENYRRFQKSLAQGTFTKRRENAKHNRS